MSSPTIVIEIEGGLVQEVYSSDPEAKVVIVDLDQECLRRGDRGVVEVPDGPRAALAAVEQATVVPLTGLQGTLAKQALAAAKK